MGTGADSITRPPRSTDDGGFDDDVFDDTGGGSGWVELVRARDDIDAHLLAGRLLEAGIESRAVKDRFAPGAWLYGGSNPWAPVTIMVRRVQLEDARLVLAEISFDAPSAGARNLGVLPHRWSRVTLWITALVLGALLTALLLTEETLLSSLCRIVCE